MIKFESSINGLIRWSSSWTMERKSMKPSWTQTFPDRLSINEMSLGEDDPLNYSFLSSYPPERFGKPTALYDLGPI